MPTENKPKSPWDNSPMPDRTKETIFPNVPQSLPIVVNRTELIEQSQERTVIVPVGSELIIFNKQFAPSLITELEEIETAIESIKPIASQDDVVSANEVLKKGQRFAKKFEDERKAMGDVLKQHTDELLSIQKKVLSKLIESIGNKNNEIVIFQKAWQKEQDEKAAKILKEQQAETARIQAENKRKQDILNLISQFESNVLNAISTATIETIDNSILHFDNFKIKEDVYMEYYQQALELQASLKIKFATRKAELERVAQLEKINKEAADKMKADQAAQALKDKEEAEQRNAEQTAEASEQAASDIANVQMATELKTSVLPTSKNVMKRWVFDAGSVDMAALPLEYHTFDESKIKAAIAAGARSIPGVRIFEEISNVKR